MKEYCIYIRQGQGTPYILNSYNSIDVVQAKLHEMVSLEELRGRPYYVDNDFFNNRYNIATNLKYFCIKVREVSDWEKYSSENEEKQKNNIIYFNNYKRTLTK